MSEPQAPTLAEVAQELAQLAAAPAAPAAPVSAAAIDRWVVQYLYNSPVAGSTPAFNYLTETAIPALKKALGAV